MSDDAKTPVLSQQMTMHVNGGSKFSELHYRIHADGKPTNILRGRRTNGSPKYLVTDDVLQCGGDEFDVLATKGIGMKEWILAHLPGVTAEENADA